MNMQIMDIERDKAYNAETAALISMHYETLKQIARAKRRQHRSGQTLLTTDILHECWLRLRNAGHWNDEAHFMRTAARAMRYVLLDYSRKKLSEKRGDGAPHQSYDDIMDGLPEFRESPAEIVEIGDLLGKLSTLNPRYVEIVDMRYFGGYTEKETADILGVTDRTIRRDWTVAKSWLAAEMTA